MGYYFQRSHIIQTSLTGFDLINYPMLNKGTAFTEEERSEFALHGLLPPHIGKLEAVSYTHLTLPTILLV